MPMDLRCCCGQIMNPLLTRVWRAKLLKDRRHRTLRMRQRSWAAAGASSLLLQGLVERYMHSESAHVSASVRLHWSGR